MYIVLVCVLVNGAMFITTNMLIYSFKYDFEGSAWYNSFTLFTGVGSVVQLLSMIIVLPVIRKLRTSEQTFRLGILTVIFALALLFVFLTAGVRSLFPLFLPAVLMYTAFGINSVMLTVSLANTVEYGRWRYGRSDESVIFSMQAFVIKLTSGLAALIVSLALTIGHIQGGAAEGDAAVKIADSSLMVLRIAMTVIPSAMMLAGVMVHKKKYILTDDRMKEITDELTKR